MIALGVPAADEDLVSEDKPRRSKFLSKRDIVIVSAVLLVLIPLVGYFFRIGIENGNDAFCRQNMKAIGQAISGYSIDNSDRLPPTHSMDFDGSPIMVKGLDLPNTWASQVQTYLSSRQSFWCRSTKVEEGLRTVSMKPGQESFDLSYGMYRALSTTPVNQIQNPGDTMLIAETINNGASKSFDPLPFGPNKPDGFLIGWNDGNLDFTKNTKSVTRLAFSNATNGYTGSEITGRHGQKINAITVQGNLRRLLPSEASVEHSAPYLKGRWWADPNLFR